MRQERNKEGHLIFTIRTPFLDKHQEEIFFQADCFVNREVLLRSKDGYFIPRMVKPSILDKLWMRFGVDYVDDHLVISATDATVRYTLPRYLAALVFVANQFSSQKFLL